MKHLASILFTAFLCSQSVMAQSFDAFLQLFNPIEAPATFGPEFFSDSNMDLPMEFEGISDEFQLKFLELPVYEEDENGDFEGSWFVSSAVARFKVSENAVAIIYFSTHYPSGSGDYMALIMDLFDRKGNRLDSYDLAYNFTWDGGYSTAESTIHKDLTITRRGYYFDSYEGMEVETVDHHEMDAKHIYQFKYNQERRVRFFDPSSDDPESPVYFTQEYAMAEAKDIPGGLDVEGEFRYAIKWKDKNGKNLLIFTTAQEELENDEINYRMWAYHFADGGTGSFKKIHSIKDFVLECPFDSMLDIVEQSVTVTDIDQDGYYESLFLYTHGCISDVSPYGMKLMMHENGKKYALRGNVRLEYDMMDGDYAEPDYTPDPAFEGHDDFLDVATKLWLQFDIR